MPHRNEDPKRSVPAAKLASTLPLSTAVDVFSHDFTVVYTVPSHRVAHAPNVRVTPSSRLVLCRNSLQSSSLTTASSEDVCTMGDKCKFVHVSGDLGDLRSRMVHVNYIWHHQDDCLYEKLPPGKVLPVSAPNNRPPVESIASEKVLVTRGALERLAQDAISVGSHCAHYYFCRMCTRGKDCGFIHVLHVDSNAQSEFKRAPPAIVDRSAQGRKANATTSARNAKIQLASPSASTNETSNDDNTRNERYQATTAEAHQEHDQHTGRDEGESRRCNYSGSSARASCVSPSSWLNVSHTALNTTAPVTGTHHASGPTSSEKDDLAPHHYLPDSPGMGPIPSPQVEVGKIVRFSHNPYRSDASMIITSTSLPPARRE